MNVVVALDAETGAKRWEFDPQMKIAPVGFNQMLTDYLKPDQTFIVCPNQDVAYGAGFTALDKGAPSRAFPRRRALCTNSKKPR